MDGRWYTEDEWKVLIKGMKPEEIERLLGGTWLEVGISPDERRRRFHQHLNNFVLPEFVDLFCRCGLRAWWFCSKCSKPFCVIHGYCAAKPFICSNCHDQK